MGLSQTPQSRITTALRCGIQAGTCVAALSGGLLLIEALPSAMVSAYRGIWSGLILGSVPSVVLCGDVFHTPIWYASIVVVRTAMGVALSYGHMVLTTPTAAVAAVTMASASALVVVGEGALGAMKHERASTQRALGTVISLWGLI